MKTNLRMTEMWTRAADEYHASLEDSPAADYLESRGLLDAAPDFKLGYVKKPAPGHEDRFKGMLAIPYQTPRGGVISDNGKSTISKFRLNNAKAFFPI